MKKWYVYELINLMGTIEWVGESCRPIERFANHINHKPKKGNGIGLFYGRCDLSIHIVKSFVSKKEAYAYQIELQKQYGLPTDIEKLYRIVSKDSKLKMSQSKKGKPRPQWVKDKIKATMLSNKA